MSYATSTTGVPQRARSSHPVPAIALNRAAPQPLDDSSEELDLRQLRHHTKNALQRILCLIAQAPGLYDTPAGAKIAGELESRIAISAAISDALFGLTRAPGSITERLRGLGESVIQMLRRPEQMISLDVSVQGTCPPALRETVLRVAHELLGNAVKHGMSARKSGRIEIRLEHHPRFRRTRLTVTDNGSGFADAPQEGEGLSLARGLAEQYDGTLRLWCDKGTVAVLDLPTPID
jgi:two-component sensor histidine kinase